MNESEFNELRELSWRRPLTAVEEARLQAYLSAHPGQQAAWEEEWALTHALDQLPNVPVSSNFTALVLQSLDRPAPQKRHASDWLSRIFPRLRWAAAFSVLILGGYGAYYGYHRHQLTQGMGFIVTAMPEQLEAFANFDAIQKLGPESPVDETLWVALNQ